MFVLLPVFILLFCALAILIWQAVRPGFGVPWLFAVGVALVNWGLLVYLRLHLPVQLVARHWQPLGETAEFPFFQMDMVSWLYAFCLSGLLLAVLLTASARLNQQSNPRAWAGSMAVAGVGILAVFSANPLTLAFSWTALDVLELGILLGMARESRLSRGAVTAFSARILGILVLIWAILLGRARGIVLSFEQIPPEISVYLLLAVGLRLGVLPLRGPNENEVPLRRGFGNTLRMAAAASSLVILARLPANSVPAAWLGWLLAFTALAVLYCAFMWLFSTDELTGRPYWLIGMAGLAIACAIQGQPLSSLAWGMAFILSGGLLFLYSGRQRSTYFLPVLGLLGLVGIPFTPAAIGWIGLWTSPITVLNLLFLLAHSALVAGYLRHAFLPGHSLAGMERWVQSAYPFGLLMLVVTQWVAAYFNLRGSFTIGTAWVGGLSMLLGLGGVFAYDRRLVRGMQSIAPNRWLAIISNQVGRRIAVVFGLNWLYRLALLILVGVRRVIRLLTILLEGDGGVLWALVLLALLISLLRTGGAP